LTSIFRSTVLFYLQVNGEDLTQATHYQAQQALAHYYPVCRLTVYREKAEENRPIEKEGMLISGIYLFKDRIAEKSTLSFS